MTPHAFSSSRRRRGFTLVELALVMGIISLIVAAILGASSAARTRNQVNQGVDELGIIANNVRAYYDGKASPALTVVCPITSFSSSYAVPVSSGVFPPEMVTGGVVNNAWNIGSGSATVFVDLCNGTGFTPPSREFVVRYSNLTAKTCTDLVVRTSMLASGINMNQIIVTSTSTTTLSIVATHGSTGANATGAVDPVSASNACAADGATVDWYYELNG